MKEWTPSVPLKGEEVDKKQKSEKLPNAITHFLPLGQGRVPRRGEGVDKKRKSEIRKQKSFCS